MVSPSWDMFESPMLANKKKPMEEEPQSEEMKMEQEPLPEQEGSWGNFQSPETYQGEPDPTEDESSLDWLTRNIAANASRAGESYFGRYGDVEKITRNVLKAAPNFLKKHPMLGGISLLGRAIHDLVGQEKWEQIVGEQHLPTTEDLKKGMTEATGEYLEPKTKREKRVQELSSDIGSVLPGPGFGKLPPNATRFLVNNLGIPAAANAVKNVVEDLGFGEDKANMAKGATWISLFLSRNINGAKYASNLMNEGRNGIPNTVQVDVPRLQSRLQQVSNNPMLLHADPRSALAREQVANIQRDLANGQTSVRALMTSYDGLNAAKRNRGLFELNRSDRNFAKRAIDEVRNAIRDEIMEAGKAHPDALKSWRSGIQAWATIHKSRAITNTVEDWAKGPYAKILTGPLAGIFGVGTYAGLKKPLLAIPAAGALPAAYKGAQTLYRIWQDPNLAHYYWQALGNAARENAPEFIKNYLKLEKGLEKDKSKSVKKKAKSNND
jgi:hypothetical protein